MTLLPNTRGALPKKTKKTAVFDQLEVVLSLGDGEPRISAKSVISLFYPPAPLQN